MNIIVCIKQIPDTNDVKWTKENNIMRENVISILNPCDLTGILYALKIKEFVKNAKITLLSMGPNQAKEALFTGLSMGADDAILLSDKRFSGADTNATSKTLAAAIKNVIKDYDLIITGQFALDGDTAQTPYSLAQRLDIEQAGYVSEILFADEEKITVRSAKNGGIYTVEAPYPFLISVLADNKYSKNPLIEDYIKAQDIKIKILNADDILINYKDIGIIGSPTYVKKAFRPENKRECKFENGINILEEIQNA